MIFNESFADYIIVLGWRRKRGNRGSMKGKGGREREETEERETRKGRVKEKEKVQKGREGSVKGLTLCGDGHDEVLRLLLVVV